MELCIKGSGVGVCVCGCVCGWVLEYLSQPQDFIATRPLIKNTHFVNPMFYGINFEYPIINRIENQTVGKFSHTRHVPTHHADEGTGLRYD